MRRALVLALLALCPPVFAQQSTSIRESTSSRQSTSFRSDPAHTGVYDSPGVPTFHKVKWQSRTGGRILSSPVVSAGTVYFGSDDHHLHALDLATGTERWKFKTGGRIPSTPAIADGLTFFLSYDSTFYAVDVGTGTLKWKFATGGEHRFSAKHLHGIEPAAEIMPDPFDFYLSSPVVSGGVVYFGSSDGNVYALETSTGAVKWKFKTGDVVHSSPALVDGTLFIGSWDTYLYALDAASGKEKWRFKTGEDHEIYNQVGIQGSPAVADGIVYFGCRDSNFYAIDAASGKQRWVFNNKGSWVINSPAIRDGKVFFATSDTGLVHALDAKSGAVIFTVDFNHWPMFSSPAIAGHMLYLGSHQGKLLAVDLTTQKLAWSFETDAFKRKGPAFTDEKGGPNYAAAFGDGFYDDIISGMQKMFSVGAILSSPAVSGDTILFGSVDGNLYAIM
jgi:outer membrane protein assembly factor BamB